jgi:hypothetical protein
MAGLSFDDVLRLAGDLPGIEQGTSYGTPALRVGKRLLCRMWEDGETLVLLQVEDIEQRFLMETRPEVFFKTPHYEGSDIVLINLARVDEGDLAGLLQQSWGRIATRRLLAAREVKP